MKTIVGWVALIAIAILTAFEGVLLALGQFGHDFNSGGPNPPSLQYGWLLFFLKVAALIIARRSGLPLLWIGLLNWAYGILFFQMHIRHLSFASAMAEGWMETSFLVLAVVYVMTIAIQQSERPT